MTTSANDQAIIAAWGRYRVARVIFSVLPSSGPTQPGTDYTVAEYEQVEALERAGAVISQGIATSLEALECKAWFALSQFIDEPEDFILSALREDHLYFEGVFRMDWQAQIAFTTVQSVRAMRSEGASA